MLQTSNHRTGHSKRGHDHLMGSPRTDQREVRRSGHLRLAPRVFWLVIFATLLAVGGVVGAAYLAPEFLIPEALVVAVVADGAEPFAFGWRGWRRRIDRTRIGMLLGWFAVALAGLSLMRIAIDQQIVF